MSDDKKQPIQVTPEQEKTRQKVIEFTNDLPQGFKDRAARIFGACQAIYIECSNEDRKQFDEMIGTLDKYAPGIRNYFIKGKF